MIDQIEKLKYAVQAVILNEEGKLLAVSRKDNHNDFGLVGGKKDDCDFKLEHAIVREIKEETGLFVREKDLQLIFSMHSGNYMGYTYLVKEWYGEIETDEPHVVKWTSIEEVMNGSFGYWNALVWESLASMGIEVYSERQEALKELSKLGQAQDVNYVDGTILCRSKGCANESMEYSKYCPECYDEEYHSYYNNED
jgi:ADP-ribose pyrophosphatase YjhB (NUDIX family)